MYGYDKQVKSPKPLSDRVTGRGLQLAPMHMAGKTLSNSGVDRVSQSLYCLISTRRGERLFQPEYGFRGYELLFEPNDFILCDMMKYYAQEDIKRWEPRIVATVEVTAESGTNKVQLKVIYSIKGDSTRYMFTYSFDRSIEASGGESFE